VQVLYGGWSAPVATDLESKINESALAAAQTSDFRNFGHGRHLWLARRAEETVVVALVTPQMKALADKTIRQFPKGVPVIRLETRHDGPSGTIELLTHAFHLVDQLGRERSQDPGRPHVPEYGRKIFRLSPLRQKPSSNPAIQRKVWASPEASDDQRLALTSGFDKFVTTISRARIGAVALDYDGTMCSKDDRYVGLRDDIAKECTRLLRAGIRLGIATGRGKSVRMELQKALDSRLWERVQVGYYNGTDIGVLSNDMLPKAKDPLDAPLEHAFSLLSDDTWLMARTAMTPRPHQITIEPLGATQTDSLTAHVMARLAPLDGEGVRLVVSSHSLDVLGPRPGKGTLVAWLKQQLNSDQDVLCIGDRGAWPGNDYALLAHRLSLSVDDVSSLDDACWNLVPHGVCGPDATLSYLQALKIRRNSATFDWKGWTAR
ncbi:MAG: hypothetical protein KDA51_10175, partial [Planctomycetales bacterium]|nr:hypothetical protein [Planctomycetales bacterium]